MLYRRGKRAGNQQPIAVCRHTPAGQHTAFDYRLQPRHHPPNYTAGARRHALRCRNTGARRLAGPAVVSHAHAAGADGMQCMEAPPTMPNSVLRPPAPCRMHLHRWGLLGLDYLRPRARAADDPPLPNAHADTRLAGLPGYTPAPQDGAAPCPAAGMSEAKRAGEARQPHHLWDGRAVWAWPPWPRAGAGGSCRAAPRTSRQVGGRHAALPALAAACRRRLWLCCKRQHLQGTRGGAGGLSAGGPLCGGPLCGAAHFGRRATRDASGSRSRSDGHLGRRWPARVLIG